MENEYADMKSSQSPKEVFHLNSLKKAFLDVTSVPFFMTTLMTSKDTKTQLMKALYKIVLNVNTNQ